jgi:hypothetical protein
MKLSDDAIIKALTGAGVPKRYRHKEAKLREAEPFGPALLDMVETGGLAKDLATGSVLEILGTDAGTTDAFYLTVRGLILKRCPIRVVNALHFIDAEQEWIESLMEHQVLAIEGMTPTCAGGDPFDAHRSVIEWQLMHWLNGERGLLLLSDVEITEDERWSQRLRRTINTRKLPFDVSR